MNYPGVDVYVKQPVEVYAYQWMGPDTYSDEKITELHDADLIRGMHPICKWCNYGWRLHGQMMVEDGVRRVCQGDWIVSGINGCNYPVHEAAFDRTYKRKEDQ